MVWQAFMHRWVQQKLRDKVLEQGAQGRQPRPANSGEPLAGGAANVGLVFALPIESGPLEDRLSAAIATQGRGFMARTGVLAGRSVAIVRGGVGSARASRATEALLAGHRPAWVISAGLAGGLQRDLRRGDIVMADAIQGMDGSRLALDLKISERELSGRPGLHVGPLLTVDRVIVRADTKAELGRMYHCLAADMESWSVAEVCRLAHVRFLAVRVISDTVDEDLPPEVNGLARQRTTVGKLGAVTGALWRRPGSVKDLWRLHEQASAAAERLAKFLVGIIEQLPASPKAATTDNPDATDAERDRGGPDTR
jgi:adenosylhomocysteine nucleosidase